MRDPVYIASIRGFYSRSALFCRICAFRHLVTLYRHFAYPNRPHPSYLCPLPPAHWNISLLYLFAIGPRI